MNRKSIVVKIGGSILKHRKDLDSVLNQFRNLIENKQLETIIIIPGGGIFANFVRHIDDTLNIGEDISHWMAIYSMNFNGKILSKRYSYLEKTEEFSELKGTKENMLIFLPFKYLYQIDELTHSWDVTSDSIALYIAYKLGYKECYLIKDVDGIMDDKHQILKEISTKEYELMKKDQKLAQIVNINELKKSKPIDPYLITLINQCKLSCIILNGKNSESRILNYFSGSDKRTQIYTKISFD
ncbi:MAG TPA: hypothetical protein VGB37_02010 [Candidatus Lokiarchaeia archaeon]